MPEPSASESLEPVIEITPDADHQQHHGGEKKARGMELIAHFAVWGIWIFLLVIGKVFGPVGIGLIAAAFVIYLCIKFQKNNSSTDIGSVAGKQFNRAPVPRAPESPVRSIVEIGFMTMGYLALWLVALFVGVIVIVIIVAAIAR